MLDTPTVAIHEKDFAVLVDMRDRVKEATARHNAAVAEARDRKKALDACIENFQAQFDRIAARARGEDLPLFQNQTDAIERAEKDPVAKDLTERLIDEGHDVNVLQVFGYTSEEREQVRKYLEYCDARDAEIDTPVVEPPAFLRPQVDESHEVAELVRRLADQSLEIPVERAQAWTDDQVVAVVEWLDRTEEVKAEKGEAVTVDDLPAAPAFLLNPAATADEAQS